MIWNTYIGIVSLVLGYVFIVKTLMFPYVTILQNINYILWVVSFAIFFCGIRGYSTNKKVLTQNFWKYFVYYQCLLMFLTFTDGLFHSFTPDIIVTVVVLMPGVYLIHKYSRNTKIW